MLEYYPRVQDSNRLPLGIIQQVHGSFQDTGKGKNEKIIRCNATHSRFLLLLRPPGIINRDLPDQGAEYKSKSSQDEHPYPSCCCS